MRDRRNTCWGRGNRVLPPPHCPWDRHERARRRGRLHGWWQGHFPKPPAEFAGARHRATAAAPVALFAALRRALELATSLPGLLEPWRAEPSAAKRTARPPPRRPLD